MRKNSLMLLVLAGLLATVISCKSDDDGKEKIWIYTSLYKDTISDIKPKLEKDFPAVKFNFFQAGSEDIATKVNAEILAGGTKADILISSDRFWYEEMATMKKLHAYRPAATEQVTSDLKHSAGFYTTLSIPVMVLSYNSDVLTPETAPKTFKEMAEDKWKGLFTTGSPLASGTNFTTVAFLAETYGWDYFRNLQKNNTLSEGGNSAVLRRIQSKERPVGWVLLENLLRFQDKNSRLKAIFPKDGSILQANVLAITNKEKSRKTAEQVADWLFAKQGQQAMIRSFMYSPIATYPSPKGAPPLKSLIGENFRWTPEFLKKVVSTREKVKETFAEVMFN